MDGRLDLRVNAVAAAEEADEDHGETGQERHQATSLGSAATT